VLERGKKSIECVMPPFLTMWWRIDLIPSIAPRAAQQISRPVLNLLVYILIFGKIFVT
jgi:hypothetical protein